MSVPPLLEVDHVSVRYPVRGRRAVLRALDDVSLRLARGETLAVVGESGCGKSTLVRVVLGLERPGAGAVRFDGVDLGTASGRTRRALRRRVGAVFQDPTGSLDPTLPVARIVAEPLRVHGLGGAAARDARARALLAQVGLDPADGDRYPHVFSGGQRQRIALARAIATDPDLLVADEPVSALDVSVRAVVLDALAALQADRQLALLLVSHDLAMVRTVAHRVAVLYLGRVVEEAPAGELYAAPAHPYAAALLAATPVPDPAVERPRRGRAPAGEPPSPVDVPPGCPYHPRCPRAAVRCRAERPELAACGPARRVACWYALPPGGS
jgi:oligopeptide/dipeptide ABC transporter ATP-binding protein